MFKKVSIASLSFLLPALAFAQPDATFGGIGQTLDAFIQFLNNILVPLVFALAFLLFIWGMFKFFILSGSNEEGREQGKSLMLWGVIAFVMMVSIWGLVNVISTGLGFQDQDVNVIPNAPQTR
jgi:hypothetical protein